MELKPRDLGEIIAKIQRQNAAEAIIEEAQREYGFTDSEVAEMLSEDMDPVVADETADAMQIIRDQIELGKRVATGLRQENVAPGAEPHFMATRANIITMRAIAAWTSPEYVEACGFTEEAYCR